MRKPEDDAVWCVVMFDLPVTTKVQRREATQFRHHLLDEGFWMAQFSVYVRYSPTVAGSNRTVQKIRGRLPAGGDVRILYLTDRQWSKAIRFSNANESEQDSQPTQLQIF